MSVVIQHEDREIDIVLVGPYVSVVIQHEDREIDIILVGPYVSVVIQDIKTERSTHHPQPHKTHSCGYPHSHPDPI